ncbi:MAG: SEC-C metal-binding domain-containing protein [Dehalococcoidales bacterium]|nr:SEC-C metal-binding domain-containing protein [Dehalococcoidales bacterium]
MPASARLIERSGDLKRDLLEFAKGPEFRGAVKQPIEKRFGKVLVGNEAEVGNFLDEFVLQHRLPDGRTVVERFVDAHPELPDDERQMLLGWRDVVEGIFEVQRRAGEALIVDNLIDELSYRVRSNMGPQVWSRTPPCSFLIARLVPVEDEWLVSGYIYTLPASARPEVYKAAVEASSKSPRAVFRNPVKLEQAWKVQREEREQFIAFFGSDEVVLRGSELAERMQAFRHYQAREVRDADGRTVADRARAAYGAMPAEPDLKMPDDVTRAETVGLIYDEVEGLHFLSDFGLVRETFADPNLLVDRRHSEAVTGYLRDDTVSPFVLRRLAQRDPERASRVFQRLLRQRGFSWERDGEALLRSYKPEQCERSPLPSITPISPKLALDSIAGPTMEKMAPGPTRPGRNDPCPCGSGKKYKRCCGR